MAATDKALSALTVLIIEDEFLIAADIQCIVEEAGATHVLLANSIATAIGHLDSGHPIDIGILDLRLGSEDGLPLAQEFRNRGIPFVVATGLDAPVDHPDLVVLRKPYNGAEVVEALLKARAAAGKTHA